MLLEVPLEQVTIMEELGQGAFGRVHKSVMRDLPKKNKSSKLGNHLDTQQGRIVATKVLHGEWVKNMTVSETVHTAICTIDFSSNRNRQ